MYSVDTQKKSLGMKKQAGIQVNSPRNEQFTRGKRPATSRSFFVLTAKGEKILGVFENEKKMAGSEKQTASKVSLW